MKSVSHLMQAASVLPQGSTRRRPLGLTIMGYRVCDNSNNDQRRCLRYMSKNPHSSPKAPLTVNPPALDPLSSIEACACFPP